ncbi:DUF2088 domain-containing protein [candidate division KSB1 bacterium]|nr:DUF2088 domain-containing protein [candidate division KSB1 bacterium]
MTRAKSVLAEKGDKDAALPDDDVRKMIKTAFQKVDVTGKAVLILIPDHTRSAPIELFFKSIFEEIGARVRKLDYMIALGTHRPLHDDEIYRRVGIFAAERKNRYASIDFYNHRWDDPAQLKSIGVITSDEIRRMSNDLLHGDVEVCVNKIIYDYDQLVVIGPVFPHEVVGFSGGAKYFFPGISGAEITNFFHWFGALLTNLEIIGIKYTPVRQVVERAASFIHVPTLCLSLVMKDEELRGLYIGSLQESWSKAVDLSSQVNIIYKERPFDKVLSMPSEMYDDLWTAAKAMYKLEPVVADGGTLLIYAPHLKEVSYTHGALIDQIGYHVRDYFLRQNDLFSSIPGMIKAHSTHVKGTGTFENGVEKPRIQVVLATGIPEERCERINLPYQNPDAIDVAEWQGREDEGMLLVKNAGEVLYRLIKKS